MKDIFEIEKDLSVLFAKINESIDEKYGKADINSIKFEENTYGKEIGSYIFIKDGKYCYGGIGDYGLCYEPNRMETSEDLYFEVCWACCTTISICYGEKNRIRGKDWRRQSFAKRIELMKNLSETFEEKTKARIDDILKENPYDDKLLG